MGHTTEGAYTISGGKCQAKNGRKCLGLSVSSARRGDAVELEFDVEFRIANRAFAAVQRTGKCSLSR